jgi:cation:H+ antiporter
MARDAGSDPGGTEHAEGADRRPLRRIILYTALAGGAVLTAGWLLASTADALAVQTGLGASFVGFVLGGLVTSLPELSSTLSAARLQQHEMVFGDAFGTNLFSLMLLFIVDLVDRGGPVLNGLGRFALFAALLGIVLTSTYLAGLIGRPKLTFLRMGVDSLVVLCLTTVGLALLYCLR